MSALGIFPGRIASLNYQLVDTKNSAQVPKMVIQIITDDGYMDQNTKKWVKKTSSFFLTAWGDRARKMYENNTLETGFTVHTTAKLTTNAITDNHGNTNYYTDLTLDALQILARPKSWHDRRNNSPANNSQQIDNESDPQYDEDLPLDDDIPF